MGKENRTAVKKLSTSTIYTRKCNNLVKTHKRRKREPKVLHAGKPIFKYRGYKDDTNCHPHAGIRKYCPHHSFWRNLAENELLSRKDRGIHRRGDHRTYTYIETYWLHVLTMELQETATEQWGQEREAYVKTFLSMVSNQNWQWLCEYYGCWASEII